MPRKNIRDFHGKPMMLHVLEAARDSGLFDEIHVSTDDEEVSQVAADAGFAPEFKRPSRLAGHMAPIRPVVRHVLQTYEARGRVFRTVALLMATAVLIDADDLRQACAVFETGDRKWPLISVSRYPVPIEWAFRLAEDGRLSPVDPGAFAIRSCDLDAAYYDAACFVFYDRSTLLATDRAGTDQGFRAFVLPIHKAIDIDTPEDLEIAQRFFAAFRTEHG